MSRPAPQQQQAPRGGGGSGEEGLLGGILRQIFGGGDRGRPSGRSPVILKFPPEYAHTIIRQVLEELRPPAEAFKGYEQEEIKRLLEHLNEEVDKLSHLGNIFAKPFVNLGSLIIDFRTARVEIKQRLIAIALFSQMIFENYISRISEEVERLIMQSQKDTDFGATFEFNPKIIDMVIDAFRLLIHILGGLLQAIQKVRIILYMNMPAEQRSPILNQLLGFDIVRPS
ncbi:MAG: hypothetical protein GXO26_04310 [Crenarchaeota archaeon]|nr:hypothetical protein [Thermoproteota archaeon]